MNSKPENWIQAMRQGQQYLLQGQLETAITYYVFATQVDPARAEGWINLGITQHQTNCPAEAVTSLTKAIRLNPNIMEAHTALGDIYRLQGKAQESINAYRRAVELKRTPMSLNKLACSLRSIEKGVESEELYFEALRIDPSFTLAKTNLATLQIELQRFEAAKEQLNAMKRLTVSQDEKNEIDSTLISLNEYFRLQPSLTTAIQDGDLTPLYNALRDTSADILQADEEILAGIHQYASSAKNAAENPTSRETAKDFELPEDWSLIEALFMIPFVENVNQYKKVKADLISGHKPGGDLLESLKMEAVVRNSYSGACEMQDAIKAEMHLRYWHSLATQEIVGMTPGHFKMTHNQSHADPRKRRAEPHLSAETLRRFIRDIYTKLPAGLPRGLVAVMAISDTHAFSDGNGRIALTWLNRELESVGQLPALFTKENGIRGKLGAAMRKVRSNGGDISFLIPIVREAQLFTRSFCNELAHHT